MTAKGYRGQTEAAKVPPPTAPPSHEGTEYVITYPHDPEILYRWHAPSERSRPSGATLWRRTIVRTYGPWEKVN